MSEGSDIDNKIISPKTTTTPEVTPEKPAETDVEASEKTFERDLEGLLGKNATEKGTMVAATAAPAVTTGTISETTAPTKTTAGKTPEEKERSKRILKEVIDGKIDEGLKRKDFNLTKHILNKFKRLSEYSDEIPEKEVHGNDRDTSGKLKLKYKVRKGCFTAMVPSLEFALEEDIILDPELKKKASLFVEKHAPKESTKKPKLPTTKVDIDEANELLNLILSPGSLREGKVKAFGTTTLNGFKEEKISQEVT